MQDVETNFRKRLDDGPYSLVEFANEYGRAPYMPEQLAREFQALVDYYIKCAPKTVLEIGTYRGGTLWYWVKYAPPGALVISIDVDHGQCPIWGELEQMRPDVKLIRVEGGSDSPSVIARIEILVDQLDFVFIDGCHLFPTIRSDWEVYGAKAKVCAFHDIACGPDPDNPHPVRIMWDEITKSRADTATLITSEPNELFYGIGIVEGGVSP